MMLAYAIAGLVGGFVGYWLGELTNTYFRNRDDS